MSVWSLSQGWLLPAVEKGLRHSHQGPAGRMPACLCLFFFFFFKFESLGKQGLLEVWCLALFLCLKSSFLLGGAKRQA